MLCVCNNCLAASTFSTHSTLEIMEQWIEPIRYSSVCIRDLPGANTGWLEIIRWEIVCPHSTWLVSLLPLTYPSNLTIYVYTILIDRSINRFDINEWIYFIHSTCKLLHAATGRVTIIRSIRYIQQVQCMMMLCELCRKNRNTQRANTKEKIRVRRNAINERVTVTDLQRNNSQQFELRHTEWMLYK